MGNALRKDEFYTVEDIFELPEGERAELIDGDMYMMAPPSIRHERIGLSLYRKIAGFLDEKGGSCEAFYSKAGVFLNEDEHTYVEPDVFVVCDPKKIKEKGCYGAPDWVIEVVSPSSKSMDYLIKLWKYKYAGVREYWIVDPNLKRVLVYQFSEDEERENIGIYDFTDAVPSRVCQGLAIDFSSIRVDAVDK
ncbi:MAG: Uma2 family endonuclease [Lachnospiraceae bacterium]|nr:Uma2 family endonuclease [Lachnospiraceae bacterium]